MSIYRHILKHSGSYAVPLLAGRVVSVLMLPIYTRFLKPADYGVLELVELTLFLITSLIGLRAVQGMLYCLSEAETPEGRQAVVTTGFFGMVIVGAVTGALGWTLAPYLSKVVFKSADYAPMFRLSMLTLSFSLPVEIGFGYLRAENWSRAWNVLQLGRVGAIAGTQLLLLMLFGMGVMAMLWAPLTAFALLLVAIWTRWIRPIPIKLDLALARRMLTYSMPLAISSMGMLVIHYGDRFFLQRWGTLADIGLYALGYKLGMMVSFVHGPFAIYWQSQMYNIVRSSTRETYARVLTYVALVLTLVAVGLAGFARPAVRLLAAPEYWEVTRYVAPIAAAYVIRSLGEQVGTVFFVKNRTIVNLRVTLISVVVNVAANAVLIPRRGVWGAVTATVITFVWLATHSWIEAQRIERYEFEYGRLMRIAIAAVVAAALPLIWAPDNFILQLAVGTSSVAIFLVLLWGSGFLLPEESRLLRERAGDLRRRLLLKAA